MQRFFLPNISRLVRHLRAELTLNAGNKMEPVLVFAYQIT